MSDRTYLDLHIHSKYSYDSFLSPEAIIRLAKKRGLNAIAITDHNTMAGYQEAKAIAQNDVLIIPGMEKKTDRGDVIGLFIQREINSSGFFDAVDEIRRQNGIVVLPHPYHRNCDPEDLVDSADLVEIFNARYREDQSVKAGDLARKRGKTTVAGSDAHVFFEIGLAVTVLHGKASNLDDYRELLIKSNREYISRYSPYYLSHGLTYGTLRMKKMLGMKQA